MASGGGRRRRQAKPRAKGRGKAKRTKYLSLSDLMVKAEVAATPPADDEPAVSPRSPLEEEAVAVEVKPEEEDGGDGGAERQQQQVEPLPFALHHVHEASTLFEALPAPLLSDILGPSSPSASPCGAGSSGNSSGRQRLPGRAQEEDLARRALRGRERWVYCSHSSPAATTSSSSPCCSSAASTGSASAAARSLLLKLDYEEILAAWADRGSLYIGASAGAGRGGGGGSPDMQLDAVQVLVEVEPSEHAAAAVSGRAERVRRYKEKRRRRLFAKRIRYEVRRVNAVKRPRFKGRFIKEHEESELRPT